MLAYSQQHQTLFATRKKQQTDIFTEWHEPLKIALTLVKHNQNQSLKPTRLTVAEKKEKKIKAFKSF